MLYTPILTQAEFETRVKLTEHHGSGTQEGVHLDFKAHQPTQKARQRELARDVAQFANTEGGVLVIGVDAPRDSTTGIESAKEIVGIEDAGKLQEWIEQALSNYLYPAFERPRLLFLDPWGRGTVAVINVDPSDVLLAVWRQSETNDGIEYVYRTTHGKQWFTPEEAAMRLSNWSSRATRIKMEQVLSKRPEAQQGNAWRAREVFVAPCLAQLVYSSRAKRSVFAPLPNVWASVDAVEDDSFALLIYEEPKNHLAKLQVPYQYVNFAWKRSDGMLALDLRVQVFRGEQGGWNMHRGTDSI